MTFFLDVLRMEALLQWRSLRFRIGAILFLVITCTPPILVAVVIRPNAPQHLGASSYLSWSLDIARFSSIILAMVLAGNRASLEGQRRMWPVLSAARVSNGGYLWRRWLAMSVLLAGLTAVPIAVAAAVVAGLGLPPADVMTYLGSWLLLLVAAAAMQAAMWLALVTIAGGELGALLLLVVGLETAGFVSTEILKPHLNSSVQLNSEWLGFRSLQMATFGLSNAGGNSKQWIFGYQLASDGAFDLGQALDWWLPRATPHLGLALLLLSIAGGFARRTRADVRPLAVGPEHPLRNLMRYVHAFRHRYTPDAALRLERWQVAAALVVLAAAVSLHVTRQRRFEALAEERFLVETETEGQWTTPLEIVPIDRHLTGELRADGSVEVASKVRLENQGEPQIGRLAWHLDPFVEVEAAAAGHEVTLERRWDRLFLTLEPPLQPGRAIDVEFVVRGKPQEPRFRISPSWDQPSFVSYYGAYRRGVRRRYSDIALSDTVVLAAPARVDLRAHRLTPVLRYTTWELTPPPVLEGEPGLEVRPESIRPLEKVVVDLAVPPDLFIADSCGQVTIGAGAQLSGRLRGTCRTSAAGYHIRGGRLEVVSESSSVIMAAMPGHLEMARQHLPAVEQVAALSAEAWPGMEAIDTLVAIEWPPSFQLGDSRSGMLSWGGFSDGWRAMRPEASGDLVAIHEGAVVQRRPMAEEDLVGRLLASRLLARRGLAFDELVVFERFLAASMMLRMGLGQGTGATVEGKPWEKFWAGQPILGPRRSNRYLLNRKIPALVVDLVARLGAPRFYAAMDAFLAADTPEKGSVRELFDVFERTGEVDLGAFYRDYVEVGDALPELRLENVAATPSGAGYLVRGELRNTGSGEAICPIVVKAEKQTRSLRVSVGADSASSFEIRLDREPYTVHLDPEKTCYRWVTKGSELVERIALGDSG